MKDIFKYEETLSKNNYILIIKMDNDLYLYMEPNNSYRASFLEISRRLFTYKSGEFVNSDCRYGGYTLDTNSLIFNKDEGFIEIKDGLILNDVSGHNQGYITCPYEMDFRNKIIPKKCPFNVLDLEIFQKI